jgi:glycosyltransferase involved in cell wall biosynthesis
MTAHAQPPPRASRLEAGAGADGASLAAGAPGGASILVPVLNEEEHIRETVAAMQRQEFDGELEFLFMDGRSTDRTRQILEELQREDARVHVLDNPARHTAAALNVGLRAARGEFTARMDAHTLYPPDYVARGVERLARGDVAWVSGPQVPQGTGSWSCRVALALESPLGTGPSKRWGDGPAGADEVELDTGVFAGVWRRATLAAHGGWDEGWPINQDSELAARFLEAGERIVSLPALAARYVPRNSPRSLARQYFRYGNYRAKTARRHPASLRRGNLLPPGLTLAVVLALAGPRGGRRAARIGIGIYGLAVSAAAARAAAAGHGRDGLGVAAVLPIMHLTWGAGFLTGSARFGPPLAAFARLASPSRARTARAH